MKMLVIAMAVCALLISACQKKEDKNEPALANCNLGISETALETQGKTEVSIRSVPAGTLSFKDADFYATVTREKQGTQVVHMKANRAAITDTCGTNISKENPLPATALNAVVVADFAQDATNGANYSYLRAVKLSMAQNDQGMMFNAIPATKQEVPTGTGVFEVMQGWMFKVYLTSPTEYELRAVRQLSGVNQTVVVRYNYSPTVFTETPVCSYLTTPYPMETGGTALSFKDLPQGTLNYTSADLYIARVTGESVHIRENTGDAEPAVVCAAGLSGGKVYTATATALTEVQVLPEGRSISHGKDFLVSPSSYLIAKRSQKNYSLPPDVPADTLMAELWKTNYRLYKISETQYELRAKFSASGEDHFLAIKYNFVPKR